MRVFRVWNAEGVNSTRQIEKLVLLPLAVFLLFNIKCRPRSSFHEVASEDWAYPGASPGQSKYSDLGQIDTANVAALRVAWVYHSHDASGGVESTPLIVHGIMYITTPSQLLIALNAVNSKEMWKFDPSRKGGAPFSGINRGIAYFESGPKSRIFYTTGNFLNSIVASTGKPDSLFGDSGRVRLNSRLPGHANTSPAAPVLYRNLVIVGVTGGPGVGDRLMSPGRRIYLSRGCVNCHGLNRQGQEGIPTLESGGIKGHS
jgi:quinoprotein glucose dehydrogenase